MDHQAEMRGFLTTRRARISPEDAGVPLYAGTRRVPGLRREEVAHLAGISVDYYTRLERGKVTGVSDEVVESVSRALQLNEIERDHLFDLVRSVRAARSIRRKREPRTVRRELQAIVETITVPAFIQNPRLDIVAANPLGWATYPYAQEAWPGTYNHPRFQFLDPRAKQFYGNWDLAVHNSVALLRAAAGRDPADEGLITLVGELSTQSEQFRRLWASHNVLRYRHGAKVYRHPDVGELTFDYESFAVSDDPGMTLMIYLVQPNSPTAEAMKVLADRIPAKPSAVLVTEPSATE